MITIGYKGVGGPRSFPRTLFRTVAIKLRAFFELTEISSGYFKQNFQFLYVDNL